ncbi:N-acetyl-gamma-glutamyl-phosphate reductase [Sphingomonas sp.]|uniref:N-acetyl-gamma-glutamyl-phosphate reductase n=1 Tax=Sphingomonas sp. TaxID=28214 RepID=UPI0025D75DED|nr:N-acetyl-gamma-glutamyl-phosphate reductase [Sphingomonas sp.]MBV9528195.1 N-acetyl-gamma-glutamyl-phosphate reductase [Sphingomonas sp.]
MIRTAILGASGYVGGELLRCLAAHPAIRATKVFGDSRAGQAVGAVHPHLAPVCEALAIERFEETGLDELDLVFAALPHGHSQRIASAILARGIPFVDLGADFRLDDAETYERWYGHAHEAPALLDRFVYGIPEINRVAIRGSKAVAAAGCYATAAILALKPLIDAGLVDPHSLVVDAASGVSGAGRELKESSAFNTAAGSLSAYGLLAHRHTAEMEMALGGTLLFTPHLAPMTRGILATCYGTAPAPCDPLQALHAAYDAEPFVHVTPEPPATKWVSGSNGARVTACYDERTARVLALCAIDNLGKGAAGQMIQCANLMLGLDESAGLSPIGVYP